MYKSKSNRIISFILILCLIVSTPVHLMAEDKLTFTSNATSKTILINYTGKADDLDVIILNGEQLEKKVGGSGDYTYTSSGNNYTIKLDATKYEYIYPDVKTMSYNLSRIKKDNNTYVIQLSLRYKQPTLRVGKNTYYINTPITNLELKNGSNTVINSTWNTVNNNNETTLTAEFTLEQVAKATQTSWCIQFNGSPAQRYLTVPTTLINQTEGNWRTVQVAENSSVSVQPKANDTIDEAFSSTLKISNITTDTNSEWTVSGKTTSNNKDIYKVYPKGLSSTIVMEIEVDNNAKQGEESSPIITIKPKQTNYTMNYFTLYYYYEPVSLSGVQLASKPGTILVDVLMTNTAPKRKTGTSQSTEILSVGKVNYFSKEKLLENAVTDREQTLSELTVKSISGEYPMDVVGNQVTVNLKDMVYDGDKTTITVGDGKIGVTYINADIVVSDGEYDVSTTVYLPVTNVYIVPYFETKTIERNIYSSSNQDIPAIELKGVTNVDAPNYEYFNLSIDNIEINGYQEVNPRVAEASISLIGTDKAKLQFSIHNMDNLSANDYFWITVKTNTQSGLTQESYVKVQMISGDMENSKESLLYVHRKPVAQFKAKATRSGNSLTGVTVSESNLSYDPDFQTGQKDKDIEDGIYAVRWDINILGTTKHYTIEGNREAYNGTERGTIDKLKKVTLADGSVLSLKGNTSDLMQSTLTSVNNQLRQCIPNEINNGSAGQRSISISLRVQDRCNDGWRNGAWSEPYTVTINGRENMPPVALFTINQPSFIMPPDKDEIDMRLTDNSYDTDSDILKNWSWVLYDCDGKTLMSKPAVTNRNDNTLNTKADSVAKEFAKRAITESNNIQKNQDSDKRSTTFKIGLIVTDGDGLTSEEYIQEFQILKDNEAPKYNVVDEKVYLIDPAEDGAKGDELGKDETNKGVIQAELKDLSDRVHNDGSKLKIAYEFNGQSVDHISKFSKAANMMQSFTKSAEVETTVNNYKKPYGTSTVTQLGFKPGVYKVSTTVSDVATGPLMINGDSSTSTEKEFWLRVIPYINLWVTYESGGFVNSQWRKSDNKTIAELGIGVDDIVPAAGGELDIVVYTNEYVDTVTANPDFDNNGVADTGLPAITLTKTDETVNTSDKPWLTGNGLTAYVWKGKMTLPEEGIENITTGLEEVSFIVNAKTKWEGYKVGTVTDEGYQRSKTKSNKVFMESVKLYDFNVTSVSDRKLSNAFKAYLGTKTGAYVKELAVDGTSYTTSYTGQNIRKGYAFDFNLKSKGLKDANSKVIIYPHFYTVDGKTELKGWLPSADGTYEVFNRYYTTGNTMANYNEELNKRYIVRYGTVDSIDQQAQAIGTMGELDNLIKTNLTSEQKWEGRYGIPTATKFTTTDKLNTETLYRGAVLVAFDFRAIKNNKEKYNYIGKNQWLKERDGYLSNKEAYVKAEEKWLSENKYIGSVIVYNTNSSVLDDYDSEPVWKE